jgi:hypothetical protein
MTLPEESPPQTPPTARLIVCERTGEWSAGLRVELAESGVRLWECRRLAEAWTALAESPGSLVIAEVRRENLAELLQRLIWLDRDFPLARAVVVADRGLARYEWLLREAGAVHFLASPRKLAPLVRLAARHIASVPVPEQSLAEQIWATLPWPPRRS